MSSVSINEPSWPTCPQCGALRPTRCPVCQTPGTAFVFSDPLPDMAPLRSVPGTEEAVSSAEDFGVRCQLCDELFRPDFYDRCHQCGYEFGDGLPSDSIEPDEVTARALIVTAALLGVFLLTVIYFGWIL